MSPPLLEVRDVSVRFGGISALKSASFHLNSGEILGLIGPNGAGKTTLLRSITGVVTPQQGEVRLAGQDITRLPTASRMRLGLGLSQQLVRPFRQMSVAQNVMLSAGSAKTRHPLRALLSTSRVAEEAKALELLALVGIAEAAERLPSELPLGFLKRLEMARALALSPRLLLLDEPLAGLNAREANRLASTIEALNAGGQSIILIEHNLGEVTRICSRLVVLDNGEVIASGNAADVMANARVREAYLGIESDDDAVA